MCEPATLTAIGTWFAGAGGTAAAGAAAGTGIAAGSASAIGAGLGTSLAAVNTGVAAGAATAGAATAGAASAGLTTAQMISLGLSAAGTATSALGAYQQAQVAGDVAARNAKMADQQAEDALRRGEREAADLQRRIASTKSSQRVSLAAKGLDLTYGTAADLQDQTDFFGASDVATTRMNARKEAFARRGQSANFQAEALSSRPWMTAGGTLLAGGGQVADKWYTYRGR